jgi:phosphoglycolate phosphatase
MADPPTVPIHDVELVVMDMAGTTVHDGGEVPGAFRSALAAHGVAVTDDELAAVRGASKREVIRTLVIRHQPDALPSLVEEVYDEFRAALAERYAAGVRAVEGQRTCSTGCGGATSGSR